MFLCNFFKIFLKNLSYTHFTSPIRRYPDLIVHRILAAALGYCPKPDYTPKQVEEISIHCNETKLLAKNVSDASCELMFDAFIKVIFYI